MKLFSQIN